MPFDNAPAQHRLATIALIDALLAYYGEDDSRWGKGHLHDGHGRRCIAGAARYLRRITGIRGDRLRHFIALSLRQKPGDPFCGLMFLNDSCRDIGGVRDILLDARDHASRKPARWSLTHISCAAA